MVLALAIAAAWTRLETPGVPLLPSSSGRSPVRAARAARWPPAEWPQMPMRWGSMWKRLALARSQRIAALTSWIWAGKVASPLSR